jgi:hypothetical protein
MKDEQKEQALTSGVPAPQSGNVGDHGHQGGLKLPGAGATTVRISALMNSLPRWFLKTSGTLRSFLLSILSLPRHTSSMSTSQSRYSVWPMPLPYPEVFCKSGKRSSGNRDDLKRLVSMQVVCLNWLALGCPKAAPSCLALGNRLLAKQWSAVKYLSYLCVDGCTPLSVDAAFMGRAASKIEGLEKSIGALARAAAFLKEGEKSYFASGVNGSRDGKVSNRIGQYEGTLDVAQEVTAKPLIAERLVFPGPPKFDPAPFFDEFTRALYQKPLEHCDDFLAYDGEVPKVKVYASAENRVLVYQKLAESGRLQPVLVQHKRGPFTSGLFAVPKDLTRDRMVLDARAPNLLEYKQSRWVQAMANAATLSSIYISEDKVLLSSGEDLRDYFYQFKSDEQRIWRNILSDPLTSAEARVVFGSDFVWPEEPVWVALSSLAMGDSLACEFAQCAHTALCLRYEVARVQELLTLRSPLPRGLLQVGVIIDDLVVLEQCLRSNLEDIESGTMSTEADQRLARAREGYADAGLETNEKKRFNNCRLGRFWGIEIDGQLGLLRASSTRLWATMFITMRVAMLGMATTGLLESLAGSWIALLGPRRRLFCLLDVIFDALSFSQQNAVIRLSSAMIDELCCVAALAPLAAVDLRCQFSSVLIATDASLDAMAGVEAAVPWHVCQELCRTSLNKGRWSKLLSAEAAWRKQHDLLECDEEVEDPYTTHPLWELCARGLHFKEVWRSHVSQSQHINLLEAKAHLREERRCAVERPFRRVPFALDSQVCLGALTKGRSSSPGINRLLKASLPYPLGGGIYAAYMYFSSKINRADGPTRDASPQPPDRELPDWFNLDDQEVFLRELDVWLDANGGSFQHELPFHLLNGDGPVDLQTMTHMKKPTARRRLVKEMKDKNAAESEKIELQTSQETMESSETIVPQPVEGFPFNSKWEEAVYLLRTHFDDQQFFFNKDFEKFSEPGALDLFSGNYGVAKQMIRAGAPWVLTFDIKRSQSENLLDPALQELLLKLLELGAFKSVGMAPICASFSRAVTPAVRSRRWPRGLHGITATMRQKVREGNAHADFCIKVIGIAIALNIAFWCENPDTSFIWIQRGWQAYASPDSRELFRLSYCRFGTRWKKNTRVACNTLLAGLRMMCSCGSRVHQQLRGFSPLHAKSWTSVAEPYPRGFAKLLAISCCVHAGWCDEKKLNITGCARSKSVRIGEAANPGPRFVQAERKSLAELPLLSAATMAMEARLLQKFIEWCMSEIHGISCEELFDRCPQALVLLLRSHGDISFQQKGSLSNFRHLLLVVQRWKPLARPFMQPAWDFVARWEAQEPTQHRIPIPEQLMKSMVVLAWVFGWNSWACATLIAFYGGGRVGEILQAFREDLILPSDLMEGGFSPIFLRLRRFKSMLRQPARVQHMRIVSEDACKYLHVVFKNLGTDEKLFDSSPYQYRKRWDLLLAALKIPKDVRITPGGLRGGFAVWAYRAGKPVQDILWCLRLRSQTTLEAYLQETAALNCFAGLPGDVRKLILELAKLFSFLPAAVS